MPALWRLLVHITGCDYGLPYGHFSPYDFLSGIGGSFLIGSVAYFFGYYAHHVCTWSFWCPRWGHTSLADGRGRACHRHHPDHPGGGRLRGEALHAAHRAWQQRAAGRPS